MKLNKKGFSPLIATVLIIGFTVALAAVILIWGQSFTKGIQENVEDQTCISNEIMQSATHNAYAPCYNATVNDSCVKQIAYMRCQDT